MLLRKNETTLISAWPGLGPPDDGYEWNDAYLAWTKEIECGSKQLADDVIAESRRQEKRLADHILRGKPAADGI